VWGEAAPKQRLLEKKKCEDRGRSRRVSEERQKEVKTASSINIGRNAYREQGVEREKKGTPLGTDSLRG